MALAAHIALYAFAAVVGACVFSFGNVLVYRVPRGIDFVRGRSACPSCGHALAARDLVPVFSWMALRGKCRYCGASIPARYTAVELAGAACGVVSVVEWGFAPSALVGFAFLFMLAVIAFIDGDTKTIPNGLVIAVAVIGLAGLIWPVADATLVDRAIGVVAVSVPLFILAVVTGGFGGGDVKLMAAVGLVLGWRLTVLAFFVGVVAGGVFAVWLLVRKRVKGSDTIAFGPFLCGGAAVAVLYGEPLIAGYLSLFGLM